MVSYRSFIWKNSLFRQWRKNCSISLLMGRESKLLGNSGEDRACEYLIGLGYQILDRNFRSHHGEIDIVAKDKEFLVFAEVKNYSFQSYYSPIYSIRSSKKQCIIHAAHYYLYKKNVAKINCRFDVIAIVRQKNETKIEHFIDAFEIN